MNTVLHGTGVRCIRVCYIYIHEFSTLLSDTHTPSRSLIHTSSYNNSNLELNFVVSTMSDTDEKLAFQYVVHVCVGPMGEIRK